LKNLGTKARELMAAERFDALFITVYPTYPALLGPKLKRQFHIPFILDYQDPWVGAWGKEVGGGAGGSADLKSRLTRKLATWLEPRTVRSADAITAVSKTTYEEIFQRYPSIPQPLCASIPLGGEANDFEFLRQHPRTNSFFDPKDGLFHLCYVGTLLPLGFETLRAFLKACQLLRKSNPALFAKLRVHFFGTSNQTSSTAPARVLPVSAEMGLDDCVSEIAPRIDYLDALTVQTQAGGILMMGSSERHYTASKIYPGILAKKPILAIYHEESSVVEIMRQAIQPPNGYVVSYGDKNRAESVTEGIRDSLAAMLQSPAYLEQDIRWNVVSDFAARTLAGKLAVVLDQSVSRNQQRTASP